jgi:hypothetical protein
MGIRRIGQRVNNKKKYGPAGKERKYVKYAVYGWYG